MFLKAPGMGGAGGGPEPRVSFPHGSLASVPTLSSGSPRAAKCQGRLSAFRPALSAASLLPGTRSLSTGAESLCSPGLHLPLRSVLKVLCKLALPRPGRDCSSCLKARSRLLPPPLFLFPFAPKAPHGSTFCLCPLPCSSQDLSYRARPGPLLSPEPYWALVGTWVSQGPPPWSFLLSPPHAGPRPASGPELTAAGLLAVC